MRIVGLIQIIGFLFATLLALYFILIQPLLGLRRYQRARKRATGGVFVRARYYVNAILREWLWLALVVIVIALTSAPLADFGLVTPGDWGTTLSLIVLGLIAALIGLGIIFLPFKATWRKRLAGGIAPVRHILPRTRAERWLWIALSISAGTCEEVVFRGFLTWYFLQVGALLGWPVFSANAFLAALALSTLIFGLEHAYQGKRGILLTALLGAVFAYCYAVTGSLLLPIALHVFVDARNAFIPPSLLKILDEQTAVANRPA